MVSNSDLNGFTCFVNNFISNFKVFYFIPAFKIVFNVLVLYALVFNALVFNVLIFNILIFNVLIFNALIGCPILYRYFIFIMADLIYFMS